MTGSDSLAVWLLEHPRLRRVIGTMSGVYVLCLWSVVTAPHASAAVGAVALGWTGLHDTDGVPLSNYFLSMVDTPEAMLNNGQHISAIDPSTWLPWLAKATQGAVWHSTIAWWLTNEAALAMFLIGLALWFLRFAMSSSWLLALVQIGRPVFAAVNLLINQMWLGPLAIAVCVTLAGFHYMHGRPGRAWNLVGTAAILTALVWTVFRDPINDLVSDHGLLGMGRATGFQIAQDARGGSYAPGKPLDAQLDGLLSQLVSATARPALQLQNFGMVVDEVGTCRQAWSRAVMAADGQGAAPAHAMKACGAPQALAHAQHLGANDFLLGLFLLFAGLCIGLFIWYVGITTLLVGAKATYYCIVVVPAAMLGMTGWQRGKAFAVRCATQVLLHGAQMMIFTVFLALSAVGMAWALTTPHFGHGGITVVPRLLLVSLGSIVGLFLFRYIDRHFYTDGVGTITHQISGAWGSARDAVRDEYDDYAAAGRRVRRVFGRHRAAGDDADRGSDGAADADAAQQQAAPGFEVVKSRPHRPDGKQTVTRAEGSTAKVAAEKTVATEAGTAAAEAGTVAAEGTATVAAPEVVIPVVAAEAAVHHVRRRHHEREQDRARRDGDRSESSRPAPSSNADEPPPVHDPTADTPSLPSVPRRPVQDSRRHPDPPPDDDPDLPPDDEPPPADEEPSEDQEPSEPTAQLPPAPRPMLRKTGGQP